MLGRVLMAALLLTLASAAPASASASHIYRSPGYHGTVKLPHTIPPAIPTPIPIGTGEKPQVLVDAAGTAHIIWNEGRGNDADAIHYCRIKRGERACDVSQLLVPDGPTSSSADPRYNSEFGTPRIFAVGEQVAVVTNRYPNPFIAPDGSSPGRSTFLFVSNDGGEHFDPGVIAGTNEDTGEPTVFGPADTQRIGLISDTQTAGTFFQEITGAKYETRAANLANEGVSTSLAPVGTSVIAAINDLSDQIHVRQWSGQGDIYDPASWSETTVPGDEPRITGGPAGTFLMSRPAAGNSDLSYNVRSVGPSGTTFGAPKVLPGTANANLRDIFEDPSGRLLATYRVHDTVPELMQTSSIDGKTWSKPLVMRKAPGDTDIARSDIAAAADGGGFMVDQESPTSSEGPILAVAFGNQAATGQPGLGNQPGGAAPPDVVDKCARVSFAAVDIQLPEGCLLGVKGDPNVKVAEGTFKLNGLEIVPDPGSKILLNARAHTIDTVGKVSVELRSGDIGPIVLYHNELHIALAAEASDAKNDGSVAGCSGQKLAGFDGGADLLGFPISGSIDVYLSQDSACIPVSLALPAAFGGIRGSAVLKANNADGLVVDSLEIDVDQAYIGPVLVEGVQVKYTHSTDEWAGKVDKVGIPPQPGGLALKGSVLFRHGKFIQGFIDIKPIWPGIPLGPWPAYLSHIGGGFGVSPPFIEADVGIGILQLPPDGYVFTIDGQFRITFSDPVTFELHGQGAIYGFQIATIDLLVNTDGFVRLKGALGIHLGVVGIDASVDTFIDVPSASFSAEASGTGCVFGVCPAKVDVIVSSKGFGACARVAWPLPDGGAGYKWGDTFPKGFLGDCDLTEYRVPLPSGAPPRLHAAQAGAQTFQVAKGARVVDLALDGPEGQAPKVALISPSGQRIEPSTDLHVVAPAYVAYPTGGGSTIVGLMKPAPGTWQVVPLDGSPPITKLMQARDATPPQVAGSVGGKGRKRFLSYRASTGNGLKTTFFEQGPMGAHQLGVAKGKRGNIKFAPATGPRGKRTIEAVVERNGIPRLRKAITTYVAPGPVRAGRVKKLTLKRHAHNVMVAWHAATGATVYAVRIDLPDGRRVLRVTKARKVTLHGAPRDGHVTVTVVARNRAGRAGPAAKATR
ncbi:MAG: hypothetical protein QOE38_1762 [Thermoleophilaceae bacterium]|nr:hypothetical protein [Thermoleophilaceae bacterium]